jgi:tRNA threonylcarbamoyladenosine biosynthesis protein TsaE
MDFYRLQDAGEVEDLGFEEYFYLAGLTVIEWSNRAVELLPDDRITLLIELINDLSRTITLKSTNKYAKLLHSINQQFHG